MTKHQVLLLAFVSFLTACTDSYQNPRKPPSFSAPVKIEKDIEHNQSIEAIIQSWEDSSYKLHLIQQFSQYSPRFEIYCGYAMASAADTIETWKIVGGDSIEIKEAQRNIDQMKIMFEESFHPFSITDIDREALKSTQELASLFALLPNLFVIDMMKKNVLFQIKIDPEQNRDIEKLKTKIFQITKQTGSQDSPCYWLGFLAREAEKLGQSLDEYWNSCNTKGIDQDGIARLVR
jgi:hypothetical protein